MEHGQQHIRHLEPNKSYALEEGRFLQGMQDSALQRENIRLTQERLQGNIADEKAARKLRDKLQEERTTLQDTIAATYETSNPELSAFVKSGLMSDDALSKLIVKKPTEWVYETEQAYMPSAEGGERKDAKETQR